MSMPFGLAMKYGWLRIGDHRGAARRLELPPLALGPHDSGIEVYRVDSTASYIHTGYTSTQSI